MYFPHVWVQYKKKLSRDKTPINTGVAEDREKKQCLPLGIGARPDIIVY